jgi:hypothetical protein
MNRTVARFALAALLVLSTAGLARAAKAPQAETCAPCKRSVCVQLCGSQGPAFCDVDPETGCPFCACNG